MQRSRTQSTLVRPESIGLLIGAARRRIKQVLWGQLASAGIKPPQLGVLLMLDGGADLSLHELAVRMWIDDPSACRLVAKLIERGMVRAAQHPRDRRSSRLALTRRGRTLARKLRAVADQIQIDIARGL